MEQSIADLANLAAQTEDQTETTQGGDFEWVPPPAGKTIGRFIEYIELGKQPQKPFKGQAKPPADMLRLTFELLHPVKNITKNEETGADMAQYISVKLSKKLGEKAKFKRLFDKMRYGRENVKHMAQMLGEAFIIDVYHNIVEAEGKKNTYVNIDKDGDYGIAAPFIIDPLTESRTPVPVRDPIKPIKIFLFDNPTKPTWDSLFIDGEREVKAADGTITKQSKNYIQETILSATNYSGSALSQMLTGVPDLPITEPAKPEAAKVEQSAPPAATPAAPATTAPAAAPAAANDALAALGLTA